MLSMFIFNDSNSKHVKMPWKKYKQRSLCIDRINKQDNSNNNRIISISSVTTNHVQTMLSSWNNVPVHTIVVMWYYLSVAIPLLYYVLYILSFQFYNYISHLQMTKTWHVQHPRQHVWSILLPSLSFLQIVLLENIILILQCC